MANIYIKGRLVEPIEAGKVKQQIRRKRCYSIELGDRLYIYTDNRVRKRRRLRETQCDDVLSIFIDTNQSVIVDDNVLGVKDKHQLALDSGFNGFMALFEYFKKTGGLPLSGQLIKWL